MKRPPLDLTVFCLGFALLGLLSVGAGITGLTTRNDVPASVAGSVQLYLAVVPVFVLLLGLLGLGVAVSLWVGDYLGYAGGLLWLALWVGQELFVRVWSLVGPETVRRIGASSIPASERPESSSGCSRSRTSGSRGDPTSRRTPSPSTPWTPRPSDRAGGGSLPLLCRGALPQPNTMDEQRAASEGHRRDGRPR